MRHEPSLLVQVARLDPPPPKGMRACVVSVALTGWLGGRDSISAIVVLVG